MPVRPRWQFSRTVSVGNLLTIAAGIGVFLGALWGAATWKADKDTQDAFQAAHIMAIEKNLADLDRRQTDQFLAVNINLADIKARLPVQHAGGLDGVVPTGARQ